jgi:hypothetical protein
MGDGDIDSIVDRESNIARKEGFRYVKFDHPGVTDKDFPVTVSLYPKEDLSILPAEPSTPASPKVKERKPPLESARWATVQDNSPTPALFLQCAPQGADTGYRGFGRKSGKGSIQSMGAKSGRAGISFQNGRAFSD